MAIAVQTMAPAAKKTIIRFVLVFAPELDRRKPLMCVNVLTTVIVAAAHRYWRKECFMPTLTG